jgi:tRNA threonylcarbamoyladenosine biosynthesis protein TsaB
MNAILAIDTAGQTAGVAVALGGEVRAWAVETSAPRHAERLFPMVDATLSGAGIARTDVACVAVTRGPGSFTGLRVGIVTAKGIAFSLGIPVVGVSTLEALAQGARPFPGLVAAALDARKRQVYAAAYDGRTGAAVVDEGAWDPRGFARAIAARGAVCLGLGSGFGPYADVFVEELGERLLLASPARWHIPPAEVARLGHEEFQHGRAIAPAVLIPTYHRLSEAEEVKRQQERR